MRKIKIAALVITAASVMTLSSCRLTSMKALLGSGQLPPVQQNNGQMNVETSAHTEYPTINIPTTEQIETVPAGAIITAPGAQVPSSTTAPQIIEPQSQIPATTVQAQPSVPDYSTYSIQQILDTYATALNLTRSYMGAITVHHKEDFRADARDVTPGGALTTQLVNTLISRLGEPSELDYRFSGGQAMNEDGETIPMLLPQKNNFTLTADGVQRATIEQVGDQTHVVIRIVPETVGFSEVPRYNSAGIGYLDTSKLDLKIVKINSCDITYTGSVIDAYIRADGYISSVVYTIGMTVNGNVSGLGVTGSGTIEGAQTEAWTLGW